MKLLVAAPRGFCAGVESCNRNCRKMPAKNMESPYMFVMR